MSDVIDSINSQKEIIGISPWARRTRDIIRRAASRSASVVILGPTGTGKELIARSLHAQGRRAWRRFVAVDCAAATSALFTGHLFGHIKGAFTGADRDMPGAFRAAEGGTVFLDEVAELDADCQAKLLRVLQQRVVTPVGSHDEIPVDVRVVAATNRDLSAEVAAGRFRADLYYRLNVIMIEALPLSARREDITLLAEHFLAEIAVAEGESPRVLTPATVAALASHPWPGNVRQLRNVIERAIVFSDGPALNVALIDEGGESVASNEGIRLLPPLDSVDEMVVSDEFSAPTDSCAGAELFRMPTVAETERIQVLTALQCADYNQSRAAAMLGVTRQQLRRRIEKHFPEALPTKRGRPQAKRRAKAA
jgi:DNA-binding NtrC family response regulator